MEGEPCSVVSVASEKGETLRLDASVAMTDDLCVSLHELESQIVTSLKGCLHTVSETDAGLSQISSLAAWISFTGEVEAAVQNGTLPQLRDTLQRRQTVLAHAKKCDHDGLTRLKNSVRLMDAIQHLDVLDDLIQKDVTHIDAWEWTKRLRFYKRVRSSHVTSHF